MIKEYGHHLRFDPSYADKAQLVSDRTRDLAELLAPQVAELKSRVDASRLPHTAVFHPPCTLQHWQGLRPATEGLLRGLGIELLPFDEPHLCCGSAGAYSVLQPDIATALRDRKLDRIQTAGPDTILSANVGCIGHLQSGTKTPVRHWIEIIDQATA